MKTAIAIAALLLVQLAHAAEPIGRIFYTPEQRDQLDLLRTQRAVTSQARDEPAPETVTYKGIVRRSDGKTTVWINGEALSEADLRSKRSIVGGIGRDGRLTLQAPQSAVELKVGQSATLLSGKIDEPFITKQAPIDKAKPAVPVKPQSTSSPKEIPAELLEALRQAAARAGISSPATTENPKTVPPQ